MTHNEAMGVLINSDRIWDGITRKEKEAINMAIVALEDCAEPKWISVTKSLPIEFLDRRILVSTVSPTGRRSVDIGLWEGGKWITYFPIGDDRVTAWMPLPTPYKGEEK